jgi:hypothetical protein
MEKDLLHSMQWYHLPVPVARAISFLHPFNGRRMKFDAGVPEDFVRMLG